MWRLFKRKNIRLGQAGYQVCLKIVSLKLKGVYEDNNGFCVRTRPDGDQVFFTFKASGALGRGGKGSYTYVGGTGKMTGIQSSGEFSDFALRPAAEGTFQGYNRFKGQYKLP